MVVLSTSLLLLNNNAVVNNISNLNNALNNKLSNNNKIVSNNFFILFYVSLLLIVTALPSVMVAINCNPNNKILYGLIAFFFSDLYLLQWAVKKFILKKENYCKI